MMVYMFCKGFYFDFSEIDCEKVLYEQIDRFAWKETGFEEYWLSYLNFSVDLMISKIEFHNFSDNLTIFLIFLFCFMEIL